MTTNAPAGPISKQSLSLLQEYVSLHGLPIQRGIEKEGLRADSHFGIAQTDHPQALGHPLTHSSITTDYSEALLELITPVKQSREALLHELEAIHRFVHQHSGAETLWAGSMPCALAGEESIRIAEYGDSNTGRLKHVYRQGLGVRYGRIMQSIAGLHFNFSLSEPFWQHLHSSASEMTDATKAPISLQDFKSEHYFDLIRNFRRHSWLLMYLFGASPALDKSFINGNPHQLDTFDDKGTLYRPYATSLRMGDLGYHNNAQSSLAICFNTLENFTQTLGEAIRTPFAPYQAIGLKNGQQYLQLNSNILQIENEYYSTIRPKRTTQSGEKPTQALQQRGVEYIEVRCLDLNPNLALGIDAETVDFLDLFLMHSLLTPSASISDADCAELEQNFSLTVNAGRDPALRLSNQGHAESIQTWGLRLIDEMSDLAKSLDASTGDERYQRCLQQQQRKLRDTCLTPSAQVLATMQSQSLSWLEYAGQLSQQHKSKLSLNEAKATHANDHQRFVQQASDSFNAAQAIKQADELSFEEFLSNYQKS